MTLKLCKNMQDSKLQSSSKAWYLCCTAREWLIQLGHVPSAGQVRGSQWRYHIRETWIIPSWTSWEGCDQPVPTLVPASSKNYQNGQHSFELLSKPMKSLLPIMQRSSHDFWYGFLLQDWLILFIWFNLFWCMIFQLLSLWTFPVAFMILLIVW